MRNFLIILLFSVFISANDKIDIGKWFTNYYLKPQPDKFEIVINELSEKRLLGRKNSLANLSSFFSVLIENNEGKIDDWVNVLINLEEKERKVFIIALYYSNIKDKYEYIKKLVKTEKEEKLFKNIKALNFMKIKDMNIISAITLDQHWGAFLASGNETHLYKIMSILPWINGKGKKLIVGNAARWSLKSNAKQHKRVLEVCKFVIDGKQKSTKEVKNILIEIVKELETK